NRRYSQVAGTRPGLPIFPSIRPALVGEGGSLMTRRPKRFTPWIETLERRDVPATVNLFLSGTASFPSFAGVGFTQNLVGTLSATVDGQPDAKLSDFAAQVRWGDGGGFEAAQIGLNQSGSGAPILIKGSHVYAAIGTYKVEVQVTGPEGA